MKRIGTILCLALCIIIGGGVSAFGASALEIDKTSPADGSTGMSVDNMGVKVFFKQDVYDKKNSENNAKLCKLIDDKGKVIPSKVVFSERNKEVMLVLADLSKGKVKIKGKTKYSLKIDKGFVAADGSVMDKSEKVTFETLDPQASMTVSMVMMGLMVVGIIFFTSREAKKTAKEAANGKKKDDKVNPYKVAKETGKSVEAIVEKENKRKEKIAAAKAKKERHARENKVEIASDNIRVSQKRPISEGGGTYKHKKAKKNAPQKSKSTNPKNQRGKQKNKGKNKK